VDNVTRVFVANLITVLAVKEFWTYVKFWPSCS